MQAEPLSSEIMQSGVPTPCLWSEGNTEGGGSVSRQRAPRSRRTEHALKLQAREPGGPSIARTADHWRDAQGSPRA